MLEALWTVEFASNVDLFGDGRAGEGSGIIIFETGRIFGGDTKYYYLGRYEVKSDMVVADIKVTNYTGDKLSVFGELDNYDVHVEGQLNEEMIIAIGYLVQDPNRRIALRMIKRANLP